MRNQSALTGTVLLEAFWSSRRKDMIDLITPFVHYAVAKITSVGDCVDTQKVTKIIRQEFGYTDIPEAVLHKVFSRDKEHFERRNRSIYLKSSLDLEAERLSQRKRECVEKIDAIGQSLFEYLHSHCRKERIVSKEQSIELLQKFFSGFALQVGLETLDSESFSYNNDEINYYIAQFIFEKKKTDENEYTSILDLTKGYFLRSAIYLQAENANIKAASYKDTMVYYDTPVLLQLLGYQSKQEADSANTLHGLLKKQGAKFYYFEQNERELMSILTAYQYSLIGEQRSSRTLEGLDARGYDFDGVTRLKNSFPLVLETEFGIKLSAVPEYAVTSNGFVDPSKIDISEADAIEYVRSHTKHYTEENLKSDVTSAIGIHRIRNGAISQEIERCKAIFVTTNTDFTNAFNSFYRDNVGKDRVMPVITSFDLSAIAWVKGGAISSDIPERQLLTNAYTAMQPAPEIIEKCRQVLGQLEREGSISKEDAILLRADRVTQRELWIEYFPTVESIDSKYIERLQQRQKEKLIGDARSAISNEYELKQKEDALQKKKEAKEKAYIYANKKRGSFVRIMKAIAVVLFALIALVCIVGMLRSLSSVPKSIFLFGFAGISVISIYDTLTSRGKVINKWIEKQGNRYETLIYEKKLNEYLQLLQ